MTDPVLTDRKHSLEPVHADEQESDGHRWARWLVIFLRVMAVGALAKGLYHWAIVIAVIPPPSPLVSFEDYVMPYQVATVFFAIIDLVSAVGLWLAAPWGAVVWLTSVISMAAVEALFPQVYGGRIWVIAVETALLVAYLFLALMAAREQPS
jgi:hypothetical protein